MPLDAEHERVAGQLERLGQPVDRRDAGHDEPLADAVDALVVVDFVPCSSSPAARAASEPGVSRTSWSAPSNEPRRAQVVVVAEALRQVLVQRAAERDVQQLHAAADAEHRDPSLDRAPHERELERVALGHRVDASSGRAPRRSWRGRCRRRRRASARRRRSSASSGVGSTSAGSGASISAIPPARADRVEVVRRQQRRLLVPHAPLRALERGADADDGTGCHVAPEPSRVGACAES